MIVNMAAESIQICFRNYRACKDVIKHRKLCNQRKVALDTAATAIKYGLKRLVLKRKEQCKEDTSRGSKIKSLYLQISNIFITNLKSVKWNGGNDPYASLSIVGTDWSRTTDTRWSGGSSVQWTSLGFCTAIPPDQKSPPLLLRIEVYNANLARSDQLIGSCEMDLCESDLSSTGKRTLAGDLVDGYDRPKVSGQVRIDMFVVEGAMPTSEPTSGTLSQVTQAKETTIELPQKPSTTRQLPPEISDLAAHKNISDTKRGKEELDGPEWGEKACGEHTRVVADKGGTRMAAVRIASHKTPVRSDAKATKSVKSEDKLGETAVTRSAKDIPTYTSAKSDAGGASLEKDRQLITALSWHLAPGNLVIDKTMRDCLCSEHTALFMRRKEVAAVLLALGLDCCDIDASQTDASTNSDILVVRFDRSSGVGEALFGYGRHHGLIKGSEQAMSDSLATKVVLNLLAVVLGAWTESVRPLILSLCEDGQPTRWSSQAAGSLWRELRLPSGITHCWNGSLFSAGSGASTSRGLSVAQEKQTSELSAVMRARAALYTRLLQLLDEQWARGRRANEDLSKDLRLRLSERVKEKPTAGSGPIPVSVSESVSVSASLPSPGVASKPIEVRGSERRPRPKSASKAPRSTVQQYPRTDTRAGKSSVTGTVASGPDPRQNKDRPATKTRFERPAATSVTKADLDKRSSEVVVGDVVEVAPGSTLLAAWAAMNRAFGLGIEPKTLQALSIVLGGSTAQVTGPPPGRALSLSSTDVSGGLWVSYRRSAAIGDDDPAETILSVLNSDEHRDSVLVFGRSVYVPVTCLCKIRPDRRDTDTIESSQLEGVAVGDLVRVCDLPSLQQCCARLEWWDRPVDGVLQTFAESVAEVVSVSELTSKRRVGLRFPALGDVVDALPLEALRSLTPSELQQLPPGRPLASDTRAGPKTPKSDRKTFTVYDTGLVSRSRQASASESPSGTKGNGNVYGAMNASPLRSTGKPAADPGRASAILAMVSSADQRTLNAAEHPFSGSSELLWTAAAGGDEGMNPNQSDDKDEDVPSRPPRYSQSSARPQSAGQRRPLYRPEAAEDKGGASRNPCDKPKDARSVGSTGGRLPVRPNSWMTGGDPLVESDSKPMSQSRAADSGRTVYGPKAPSVKAEAKTFEFGEVPMCKDWSAPRFERSARRSNVINKMSSRASDIRPTSGVGATVRQADPSPLDAGAGARLGLGVTGKAFRLGTEAERDSDMRSPVPEATEPRLGFKPKIRPRSAPRARAADDFVGDGFGHLFQPDTAAAAPSRAFTSRIRPKSAAPSVPKEPFSANGSAGKTALPHTSQPEPRGGPATVRRSSAAKAASKDRHMRDDGEAGNKHTDKDFDWRKSEQIMRDLRRKQRELDSKELYIKKQMKKMGVDPDKYESYSNV